jgi:Cu-Zn family superoxide dismutase
MLKTSVSILVVVAATALTSGAGNAQEAAMAAMQDRDGNNVGEVTLKQTPNGVLLTAELKNLPEGAHAFHVHEVGECVAPFKSAGGHYSPDDSKHGFLVKGGPHAGDMPNIHVPASGELTIEVFNSRISLAEDAANTVFDDDGSTIIIHEGGDDYESQPAGAAGPRIACGVIERQT